MACSSVFSKRLECPCCCRTSRLWVPETDSYRDICACYERANTSSSKNLWDLAATRLSDKDKAYLDLNSTTKLDDLLQVVSSRRQECEQRQWTVKKTVLRDVFAKIAKWVEKFVEVGNVAVQYDPGHAALPWAALRFLLKVCIADGIRMSIADCIEGLCPGYTAICHSG